jgi:hypothetical protein
MVAVTDAVAEEPIWWLVPAGFVSVQAFTIGEVDEGHIRDVAAIDDVDPIEDLPPSDPRHQGALEERAALERDTLLPLPVITYGEVPDGFSQAVPKDRAAPSLVAGRQYLLTVMGGGDAGQCHFKGA